MKTNTYLLPHRFKKIGSILFIPFAVLGIYWLLFEGISFHGIPGLPEPVRDWLGKDCADEFIVVGLTVSMLMVGFSREKIEDEFITKLRGDSLIWALLVSYLILIVATLVFYDETYLTFVFINMFLILLLYILKFNLAVRQFKKANRHEE